MKIPTPKKVADFLRNIIGISFIALGALMEFKSEIFNYDEKILVIAGFVLLVLGLLMLFYKRL